MKPLTRKTLAVWTAIMTAILAVSMWGFLTRVGPLGFSFGFLSAFIAIMVLSLGEWGGRFERLLPAVLATALVGLWPLFGWLVSGETRSARAFFFAAGFINVLLLLFAVMELADRRGWVNQSPIFRRLNYGLMMLLLLSQMADWPTGAWRSVVTAIGFGVYLPMLFWPGLKKSVRPRGPVAA